MLARPTAFESDRKPLPSASPKVTLKPAGDCGLLVEVAARIAPDVQARVLQLDEQLGRVGIPGVIETIFGYASLLVIFDPARTDYDALTNTVRQLSDEPVTPRRPVRRWRIPVAYGGEFGVDLPTVAAAHGLSADAVVTAHAGASYTLAMFGFLPGFAYLSGLPGTLATPRRTSPRMKVPAGSIAIGGEQTAIGSIEGPSGWHVIGRTPLRTFDPQRYPSTVFATGDEIMFEAVDPEAFHTLAARAAAGELVAERIS
ncbi:MAG: 5-oxoprolinase subunit PxpB [Hyphomicrobiaceae bacterium]|nr:5-oxoprolinase subunit PxpB [Hyphomicrobiaceae bacterium]